jgi:hypothetical protein
VGLPVLEFVAEVFISFCLINSRTESFLSGVLFPFPAASPAASPVASALTEKAEADTEAVRVMSRARVGTFRLLDPSTAALFTSAVGTVKFDDGVDARSSAEAGTGADVEVPSAMSFKG